jgi:hypothetical protein
MLRSSRSRIAMIAFLGLAPMAHAHAAERKAPVDRFACPDDLMAMVRSDSKFKVVYGDMLACRLNPEAPGEAIVAYALVPPDMKPDRNGNFANRLYIRVFDVASWALLSSFDDPADIDDNGARFDGISLDTGRYQLASRVRAFGVRIRHRLGCHGCGLYSDEQLALYVRKGDGMAKVLPASQVWVVTNDDAARCPQNITTTTTVLSPIAESHHGLADLLLTSSSVVTVEDTSDPSIDQEPAKNAADCPKREPSKRQVLRFDGERYGPPVAPYMR